MLQSLVISLTRSGHTYNIRSKLLLTYILLFHIGESILAAPSWCYTVMDGQQLAFGIARARCIASEQSRDFQTIIYKSSVDWWSSCLFLRKRVKT
jgi:hypothetical protein